MRLVLSVIITKVQDNAYCYYQQVKENLLPDHISEIVGSAFVENSIALGVGDAVLETTLRALNNLCLYQEVSYAAAMPIMFTKAWLDQLL